MELCNNKKAYYKDAKFCIREDKILIKKMIHCQGNMTVFTLTKYIFLNYKNST